MKHILIVDDDVAVTNYFRVFLAQTGLFEATIVNDSREVMPLFDSQTFDIVLLDMDMPHVSGMEILQGMRNKKIDVPVVVLTGVNDVDLAVKSMKFGAFDYIIKPVDDEKLLEVIDEALAHCVLRKSIDDIPNAIDNKRIVTNAALDHLPTQDPEMIRVLHQAEKCANSDLSIFIWGESGTGKERLARAIHNASPRKDKPFIAVEVNNFEPDQFPAFFFGQVRGWSGTREESPGFLDEANGGTLFLNNIEHLNFSMQTRLRRLIQTNEYYRENSAKIHQADVRMIVSSVVDLSAPEFEKTFNRDLLYHLTINSLKIPPIRERIDDVPLLAEYFLKKECKNLGKKISGFTAECMTTLKNFSYPNNVQAQRRKHLNQKNSII